MALIRNISIDQGATYSASLVVYDDAGLIKDLTNYPNAKMQIKKNYTSSTVTAEPTVSINGDPVNGTLDITMTAANTKLIPAGRYVYDIIISNVGNTEVLRVVEGIVTIHPAVSSY